MKICQTCDQLLAESMTICPSCGDEVVQGRKTIDDYLIVEVLQEGDTSVMCKAVKAGQAAPVLIRLFKDQAGVDEKVAKRLQRRLVQLNELPDDGFVKHFEVKRSIEGLWYRVSEWVDGEDWSMIFASGILKNTRVTFDFFHQLATSLSVLHGTGQFMPHLVLSDIIAIRQGESKLTGKIDYKLSRFLNRNPLQSGTMLSDLLQCHPDIVNKRPLDFRSDIWSLGKIFFELLSTNLGGCPLVREIESLKIPRNAKTLLKTMLAQDPSLRPQTMREVADSLSRIQLEKPEKTQSHKTEKKPLPFPELQRLRNRVGNFTALLVLFILLVVGGAIYFGLFKQDIESALQQYANRYSNSVAFVLVEYSLKQGETLLYRKRTEGTAFLVDDDGYLVTNRHVAAPWLLDRDLTILIGQMNRQQLPVQFDYQLYLWFEGQKAYQRIPTLEAGAELADIYYLDSAYSSQGKPRVEIAGIERSVIYPGFIDRSPLKDDFAILKIDKVPEGLIPIPLDESPDLNHIKKLSPVITIGFPLGSRTQANSVNVSVTKGNVRRTFEDMIQVDTSIYRGNSGGPLIGIDGKAIGIATGIMFDTTIGMMPVLTPLSDIGMVLPITRTVSFLKELKAGHPKWNGALDLSIDHKVDKIKNTAIEGNWKAASIMADNELKFSLEPKLFITAGYLHYCLGDYPESRQLFERVISMDDQFHEARMMLYLIDWINGNQAVSAHRRILLEIDWRSSAEFFNYLTRILEGQISLPSALRGWQAENEKAWIYYVAALVSYKNRQTKTADLLLKQAATVADKDSWVLYLILSELKQAQDQRFILSRGHGQKVRLQAEVQEFYQLMFKAQQVRAERLEQLTPLYSRLLLPSVRVEDRISILNRMREIDPENKDLLTALAFLYAMAGEWQSALVVIDNCLKLGGREHRTYLSLLLLKLGAMNRLGTERSLIERQADQMLEEIKNEWYRTIIRTLRSQSPETLLTEKAAENPAYLLTAHFTLGLWKEGNGQIDKAVNHYKEALSTYLDGWWEYEFANIRIRRLRTP